MEGASHIIWVWCRLKRNTLNLFHILRREVIFAFVRYELGHGITDRVAAKGNGVGRASRLGA